MHRHTLRVRPALHGQTTLMTVAPLDADAGGRHRREATTSVAHPYARTDNGIGSTATAVTSLSCPAVAAVAAGSAVARGVATAGEVS